MVDGSGAPGRESSSSSRSSNCLVTSCSDSEWSLSVRVHSLISGVSSGDDSSDEKSSEKSEVEPVFLIHHPSLSLGGRAFFFFCLAEEMAVMSGEFLYLIGERLCF
jgi:hypothetical protein